MTQILVVEDEQSLAEGLAFLLRSEGYSVLLAADGEEAIDIALEESPDLILLDLMLPKKSGIEVCKAVRKTSNVPIIMLTAKDTEMDKVLGLEIGADDYVTKPYSSRELIARVRAILRRGEVGQGDQGILAVGSVRLDIERHICAVDGVPVSLPLKEFELLEFLMRNAGRVLTRMQLIDRVWGSDYVGDTKTLDVHIKRLRAKIEADPTNPLLIQTVRGMGYKMERVI